MKRLIDVHTGEVVAGQGEVVLQSDAKIACLVIAAYDATKRIGALAHARFLLNGFGQETDAQITQDASKAIDEMVTDMALLGARKDDIEVCLVTGENVHGHQEDLSYNRNITSTIDLLRQKHIRLRENQRWDASDLHVALDVASGNILYS